MVYITAKTPRQLDIGLRLLHAEKVSFVVLVEETSRGKIVYQIQVCTEYGRAMSLVEKFRILTA